MALLSLSSAVADTAGGGFSDGKESSFGSVPQDAASLSMLPDSAITIAPDGAWTWFNDERAIFHEGFLYSGYVRSNGDYGVTRFDPATGTSVHSIISTADSRERDDHNNPSITALPDGRLLLLYSRHHTGFQFYQRTSLNTTPATIDDWGPEVIHPVEDKNTYNNTYILSAESNRIYNFQRNLNFNPSVTVSDDLGETWQRSIPFIEVGTGKVRPYPRYCSNHTDRIDLIYTDGHPRQEDNSVYHMFYQSRLTGVPGDGSFYQTDGARIDAFADLPLDHQGGRRGSVVYPYSDAQWDAGEGADDWIPSGRGWTWDVHYGEDGHPVCVFQVQVNDVTGSGWKHDRIYYYYARWTGREWQKRFIAQAGRGIYSRERDYGGGMTIDPENPNVVYISSNAANPFALDDIRNVPLNTGERYELYRGVTRNGGLTFEWEPLTVDSAKDNLRPVVPEKHGVDRCLVWFYGEYRSYTDFDCEVLGIFKDD